MTRRRTVIAVSGLCGAFLFTSCGSGSESERAPSTGGVVADDRAALPLDPEERVDTEERGEELQTLSPWGELSEHDRADACQRAVEFLTAFSATDRDTASWWAGLQPLLDPAAAQDYSYVDPSEVAPFTVEPTAAAELPGGSSVLIQVQVSTSIGDYIVTLSRTGVRDPWLISRADPPAEGQ